MIIHTTKIPTNPSEVREPYNRPHPTESKLEPDSLFTNFNISPVIKVNINIEKIKTGLSSNFNAAISMK
jgi:hypothetical protein